MAIPAVGAALRRSVVEDRAARHASRKAAWRLIPFLILCFVVAFLDRVNVGFAALTMNKELGLTAEMFGFGAGIFFLGYFIFEVPSNLILEKVGARRWIARIMISWGVIAVSFAFVSSISAMFQSLGFSFLDNARTFYLMRFIFGAAEAGSLRASFFILPTGSRPMKEHAGLACS
jgi:ACS family tartrate transporter-like MFS transporter